MNKLQFDTIAKQLVTFGFKTGIPAISFYQSNKAKPKHDITLNEAVEIAVKSGMHNIYIKADLGQNAEVFSLVAWLHSLRRDIYLELTSEVGVEKFSKLKNVRVLLHCPPISEENGHTYNRGVFRYLMEKDTLYIKAETKEEIAQTYAFFSEANITSPLLVFEIPEALSSEFFACYEKYKKFKSACILL